MKGKTFFSVVLIFFISAPLFSANKMRIAILDMKGDGVSGRTARIASNMIRNEFINLNRYTVVERNQMNMILKEQGFQKTGCTDQSCAVQLGRLMSARKILVGEVSALGKELILTVRIVDVEKGVSDFAAKEKAPGLDTLDTTTARLVKRLSARIQGSAYEGPSVKLPTAYYLWGIIPGAGQIYAGSTIKGVIIMSAFAGAGGAFGWGISNYYTKKDAYDSLGTGATANEFNSKYDSYQQAGTLNIVFAGILGAIYIYNWIDLVFFTDFRPATVTAKAPTRQFFYTCTVYDRHYGTIEDRRYELTFGMRF